METGIVQKTEKKKSMRISVILHIIILALALIPLTQINDLPDRTEETIFIQFSSAGGASSAASKGGEAELAEPKMEPAPVKPAPVTPIQEKVVTADNIETPAIQEKSLPTVKVPEIKETPEPEVEEVPEPTPVEETEAVKKTEVSDKPAKEAGAGEGGNSDTPGEGDAGNASEGSGTADNGSGPGMFEGDGELTRRIIERSDMSKVVKKNGVIAANVCVNRNGAVVYIEYNPEYSTITDETIIRDALDALGKYRFESDRRALKRECGRMTVTVTID